MEKLVIYGRQPVIEALRAGHKIDNIHIARDAGGKPLQIIEKLAAQNGVAVRRVPKDEIQRISGPVVHQGVAARAQDIVTFNSARLEKFLTDNKRPFLLALDQIQDPHNLGAILRTAEICGVDAVLLPEKGSADLNATVAKTSAGAMFHLRFFRAPDIAVFLEVLNKHDVLTAALMPSSEHDMYSCRLDGALALVVGSEGRGVRKNIARLCRERVAIPQYGRVASLNASVAAAVVLYEALRQRRSNEEVSG